MTEIIGAQTIVAAALPTGVDGTVLATWRLKDGRTWREHVSELALVLAARNAAFVEKWGDLFSFTDDIMVEYPQGSSVTKSNKITDVSDITPTSGDTIGHMINLFPYGEGVGGTWMYFRDARPAKFRSDIQTAVNKMDWRMEYELLNRFFTNTENAIGAAGYDVPFVRGNGGNVDFVPPAYAGRAFDNTHNHFVGFNASTPKTMADVLNGLAATLVEHGHMAPFTAIVSQTDVDAGTFKALTDFVQFVAPIVQTIDRAGVTSGSQFFTTGQFALEGTIGYFQSLYGQITLRMTPRLATGYVGMYKSYGRLDARNPLWIRIHPDVGFGMRIVPEKSGERDWPIKQANFVSEFAVGTGADRTNGAAGFLVAGGSWTNASIG